MLSINKLCITLNRKSGIGYQAMESIGFYKCRFNLCDCLQSFNFINDQNVPFLCLFELRKFCGFVFCLITTAGFR